MGKLSNYSLIAAILPVSYSHQLDNLLTRQIEPIQLISIYIVPSLDREQVGLDAETSNSYIQNDEENASI